MAIGLLPLSNWGIPR